jgi:Ca2+-transporting ATPase
MQEDVDEGVEQELVFLGLIGMIDPPREEAKESVARAKGAGRELSKLMGVTQRR